MATCESSDLLILLSTLCYKVLLRFLPREHIYSALYSYEKWAVTQHHPSPRLRLLIWRPPYCHFPSFFPTSLVEVNRSSSLPLKNVSDYLSSDSKCRPGFTTSFLVRSKKLINLSCHWFTDRHDSWIGQWKQRRFSRSPLIKRITTLFCLPLSIFSFV